MYKPKLERSVMFGNKTNLGWLEWVVDCLIAKLLGGLLISSFESRKKMRWTIFTRESNADTLYVTHTMCVCGSNVTFMHLQWSVNKSILNILLYFKIFIYSKYLTVRYYSPLGTNHIESYLNSNLFDYEFLINFIHPYSFSANHALNGSKLITDFKYCSLNIVQYYYQISRLVNLYD